MKEFEKINIIENREVNLEKLDKIKNFFQEFNIDLKFSKEFDTEKVNINLVNINKVEKIIFDKDLLIVNVPILEDSKAEDSLKLKQVTSNGLWVGLNRYENAALSCIQLLNYDNRFSEKLKLKRKKKKKEMLALKENH
jgi:hypothetical protein